MSNIIDLNEVRKKKEKTEKEMERVRKTLSDIVMEDPSIFPPFGHIDYRYSEMNREQLFRYLQHVLLYAGVKPIMEDGKIIGQKSDPDISEDPFVFKMYEELSEKIIELQNEKPNND